MQLIECSYLVFPTYDNAREHLLHYLEDPQSCTDFKIAAGRLRASWNATSVEHSPFIWLIHKVPEGSDSLRSGGQHTRSLEPRLIEVLLPGLATSQVEKRGARRGTASAHGRGGLRYEAMRATEGTSTHRKVAFGAPDRTSRPYCPERRMPPSWGPTLPP